MKKDCRKASYIDPLKEIGALLLNADKPSRYTGGEFAIRKNSKEKMESPLKTLIAFPDLYEIGMGNQALQIIYSALNEIKGICCDRAFAPAPDFEKLLREKKIPLYGLDTGIALGDVDLLLFTLGYELGLNGILLMLDVSNIPLRCAERNESHPIVIAGGPAVSNPLPYSLFIDAFWIGEAEAGFFDLAGELAILKKRGQGRVKLLEKIISHENIWTKGKNKTRRAIYTGFAADENENTFPVPSMKIVQNHGSVEIMRGCPNGCRFCHAGFWYRPMRQKSAEKIILQAGRLTALGWNEISLSSLSSGDYNGIGNLVDDLNTKFSPSNVSFQLPSLKVTGFSLDLLKKIAFTRKSSLTFAVETPLEAWQMSINKKVTLDTVTSILEEAKKRGWKSAKFYFMIGLPLPDIEYCEEKEIVNFITQAAGRSKMRFNINIGIFIPKPHTPYQRCAQIGAKEAYEKLKFIRLKLKPLGHKVSVSDTLISDIEGLLSRGDERAGLLCEKAYKEGSRLDAWDEYIKRDVWQEILNENSIIDEIIKREELPWEIIDSCVKNEYFKKEYEKSQKCELTSACGKDCRICGVCAKETAYTTNTFLESKNSPAGENFSPASCKKSVSNEKPGFSVNQTEGQVNENAKINRADPDIYRVIFSFSKTGNAVFHGHLNLIEIFSFSLRRAGLGVLYTRGFNPLIKIEFASPLTTGVSAENEIASVDFPDFQDTETFIEKLNISFPQGIFINRAECFFMPGGIKKHSLSSLLWGFSYEYCGETFFIKTSDEKNFRKNILGDDRQNLFSLKRKDIFAHNPGEPEKRDAYFDVYRKIYC